MLSHNLHEAKEDSIAHNKLSQLLKDVEVPTTRKDTTSFGFLYAGHGLFGGATHAQRSQNQEGCIGSYKQRAKDAWVNHQVNVMSEMRSVLSKRVR